MKKTEHCSCPSHSAVPATFTPSKQRVASSSLAGRASFSITYKQFENCDSSTVAETVAGETPALPFNRLRSSSPGTSTQYSKQSSRVASSARLIRQDVPQKLSR